MLFRSHRSHGHFLALGAPLESLLAEILGKDTGCSRGMGGSMHLRNVEHNFWGSVPSVAATIPIAVGTALAARMDGGDALAVSILGAGATEGSGKSSGGGRGERGGERLAQGRGRRGL